MNSEYTAIIRQSGDWWIGWIEEIPGVNCQLKGTIRVRSTHCTINKRTRFCLELSVSGQR